MTSPVEGARVNLSITPVETDIVPMSGEVTPPAGGPDESAALRRIRLGLIVNEALPTDDLMRYGLLLATQAEAANPAVGAAVHGLSYFAVGSSAVLASSRWIAEDRIGPIIDRTRNRIDSFKQALDRLLPGIRPGRFVPNIPEDPEVAGTIPFPVKAVIALNLGTVVLLGAMQRRNPQRTAEQNRRQGLLSVALVSGYLAVEGALISTGLANLTRPQYLLGALAGLLGMHFGAGRLRKWFDRRNAALKTQEAETLVVGEGLEVTAPLETVDGGEEFDFKRRDRDASALFELDRAIVQADKRVFGRSPLEEVVEDSEHKSAFRPRYDLTQEELDTLDKEIVAAVEATHPDVGVYAAIIDPDHPFSNFVRGHEGRFFPEAADFPAGSEDNTLLFALVDTRQNSKRVVHVGTVSGPGLRPIAGGGEAPQTREDGGDSTGFLFVDDLVGLGNFTPEDFRRYYEEQGIDLDKSIAVETNIKIGRDVEKYRGVRTVDLGYLTLFGLIERNNPEINGAAVFASVNKPQMLSFQRVGISYKPLMGREDFLTPESQHGRVSKPVAIIYDERYRAMFRELGPQLQAVRFSTK